MLDSQSDSVELQVVSTGKLLVIDVLHLERTR